MTPEHQIGATTDLDSGGKHQHGQILSASDNVPEQDISMAIERIPKEDSKTTTSCSEKQDSGREIADSQDLDSIEPLSTIKLMILGGSFAIANFMVGLDSSVIATAIPRITSEFERLDQIGWYGSAYLLTTMSTQPTFGQIFTYFNAKWTFLITLLIFEAGSIICASAPSSVALIVGRAVAGTGAAGILCGSLAIFGQVLSLRRRPLGTAILASVYGLSGILGPTLGGLITDSPRLTWRFCFWVNLPFGAIAIVSIFFALKSEPGIHRDLSLKQRLSHLDLVGGFMLNCGLICLFIALDWGGNVYPWSDSKVWGCLVGSGIFASIFVFLQVRYRDTAIIPPRIVMQRTACTSFIFTCLTAIAVTAHEYYLPFYFQAAKGTDAARSGIDSLPYVSMATIGTIISGVTMTLSGHYVPFMYAGSIILTAGSVLLHSLTVDSNLGQWLGYQSIAGLGMGLAIQVPFIAVQVVVSATDIPLACSLIVFFRCFGGALGISVAQSLFSTSLLKHLKKIPGIDTNILISAGAGHLSSAVIPTLLNPVREAYCYAINDVWILSIAVASASVICCLGMEWKTIINDRKTKDKAEKDGCAEATECTGMDGEVLWEVVTYTDNARVGDDKN